MRVQKLLLAAVVGALLASPVLADTRTGPLDVIIALDKSLSMENKIGAVKDWVTSYIIDQLLIPGDYLAVIAFYGKADVIISRLLKDDADRAAMKSTISQVRGDGRFTDIGNALDAVKEQMDARASDGRPKYVLLLTDGIQEAPPASRYYSPDGKFNHDFLANTKTIPEKGWKIMILGIGTDTAAKDLAHALQSQYGEVNNDLTGSSLTQQSTVLFGTVTLEGPVVVAPIAPGGESRVRLTLKSAGIDVDVSITLSGISARVGTRLVPQLLEAPATVTVKKNAETKVSIPVRFPPVLPQGTSSGVLDFSFSSGQAFTPAEAPVSLTQQGVIQSNLPLFGGVLAALLIIAALILLLLRRLGRGGPLQLEVTVGDAEVAPFPASLAPRGGLFLNEIDAEFTLTEKKTGKSLARLGMKEGKLRFDVLKADRFPRLKEIPEDARGHAFPLRSENGRNLVLKVLPRERKK